MDRVPLAEILRPDDLAALCQANRGRCYEAQLTFVRFVELMRDCRIGRIGRDGSARPARIEANLRGELAVSLKAFYDKWKRAWAKAKRRRDPAKPVQPRMAKLKQKKRHDSVHRVLNKAKQAATATTQ